MVVTICALSAVPLYHAYRLRRFQAYQRAGAEALRAGEPGAAEVLLRNGLLFAEAYRPSLRDAQMACAQNLGLALFRQRKYSEALTRLEDVVRECSSWRPHSDLLLAALKLLARTYWELGHCREAVTLRTWILDFIAEHSSSPDRLSVAHSELGLAYLHAGDYERAGINLERAVALERQSDGDLEKSSTSARWNRGVLHERVGEFEQANLIWEEVLGILEKAPGGDPLPVARIRANLVWLRRQQKRYTEAEALARQLMDGVENDQILSSVLHTLAVLCTNSERLDEAGQLFARAKELRSKLRVADHPEILKLDADIADLRMAQGRIADAEELLTAARTVLEAKLGAQHPEVASVLYRLGLLRARQGRIAEAKGLLQAALNIKMRTAPVHPETEACRGALEELGA
jgi:tetratricopeptide (TPR) repeat protein